VVTLAAPAPTPAKLCSPPTNVSKNSFGRLFSVPVDYVVMAQPLYVPNVNIPGQGAHNVIYIVTQADSVYAIDADTGAQLWYASMLNVGGTTASGIYLPCGTSPGYNQEGIVSTPVIDPTTNTMYLVAKTLLNTTVRHHLHALDITTGYERAGSPVLITATSTSNKGHVTVFDSKHQKKPARPLVAQRCPVLGLRLELLQRRRQPRLGAFLRRYQSVAARRLQRLARLRIGFHLAGGQRSRRRRSRQHLRGDR